MDLRPEIIYNGGYPQKKLITIKAGNLSMIYEGGNIRYISVGNSEILRMIYSAVRDSEWNTIEPSVSNEEIKISDNSFSIKYKCRYKGGEIDFDAYFSIEGRSDSSLTFSFEGIALKTFEKNRIGFCVLHPVEGCSGNKCEIIHTGGLHENLVFPSDISPHQPFLDIRSMLWEVKGVEFSLNFDGDVFETEDQRNWTDASYKTYCTPLDKPRPVTIMQGERISQKVTFSAFGNFRTPEINDEIKLTFLPGNILRFPEIGIGKSTRPHPLTNNEIEILKKIGLDHYRTDLYLFENGWKEIALEAADEAGKLGYRLELALFFDDNAVNQCSELTELLSDIHADPALFTIFSKNESSTSDNLTDAVAPLLRSSFPGVRIACGTNANFARLNRNRPDSSQNDLIAYPVYPQEHASDNLTLTENLKGQSYTISTALGFSSGNGIWISPVTIQRRFNPNVANYEKVTADGTFPPQIDSRLMSLYGACWTAGSLKYLCESGAEGITFYETAGERGIIQGDYDSRWPGRFPAYRGMIFPVYFVFRYLAGLRGMKVIKSISSDPLHADCLALSDGRQIRVILVNFTSEIQKVVIKGCTGMLKIRELNAESYSEAANNYLWTGEKTEKSLDCGEKLRIEPFSINFIEGWLK